MLDLVYNRNIKNRRSCTVAHFSSHILTFLWSEEYNIHGFEREFMFVDRILDTQVTADVVVVIHCYSENISNITFF